MPSPKPLSITTRERRTLIRGLIQLRATYVDWGGLGRGGMDNPRGRRHVDALLKRLGHVWPD